MSLLLLELSRLPFSARLLDDANPRAGARASDRSNRPRTYYYVILVARSRASPRPVPVTNRIYGIDSCGQRRATMCRRHVRPATTISRPDVPSASITRKSRFYDRRRRAVRGRRERCILKRPGKTGKFRKVVRDCLPLILVDGCYIRRSRWNPGSARHLNGQRE